MKYGKAAAELIPVGEEPAHPLWGRSAASTRIHGDLFTTGESWDADA
ncbi:MAG: hypothetical protein JJU00_12315 [Opitutales bacterium]|nr:hypothetical protein [Opitutales bacterium]